MSHSENLLLLQDLDIRIRDARRELKDIPERQNVEKSRLDEHTGQVAEAEKNLKARQAAIKELELESNSRKEKIDKFRQQQLQLKTNKEFRAMEAEIEAVKKEILEIEDRELVLMEHVETARAELNEKQQALTAEDTAVQQDIKALDGRAARIQEETDRLEGEREVAAAKIDAPWLARYESVIERRDMAVVRLTDGVCGGCHMKLPPSVSHDSRKNPAKTTCPYCGRLLY